MKRILLAVSMIAVLGAPAYAGDHWRHRHHDHGTSDTINTLLKLQLLGLAVNAMQQPVYVDPYAQRSYKDQPYRQPRVQGDPYPPLK